MRLAVSLLFLTFLSLTSCTNNNDRYLWEQGAIVRGDTTQKKLSLVFTGHEFADGAYHIEKVLKKHQVKGTFFFTGDFYRNPEFEPVIMLLVKENHYLGAHSDKHLLYCDWVKRDSLLVTEDEFKSDLRNNYMEMEKFGIAKNDAPYFMPPYEWYNQKIADWTGEEDLTLINFTTGTRSNADYTTPSMDAYIGSGEIYQSIMEVEQNSPKGVNGFIMLIHIGTHPDRRDKFYLYLDNLIEYLKSEEYELVRVDKLLSD